MYKIIVIKEEFGKKENIDIKYLTLERYKRKETIARRKFSDRVVRKTKEHRRISFFFFLFSMWFGRTEILTWKMDNFYWKWHYAKHNNLKRTVPCCVASLFAIARKRVNSIVVYDYLLGKVYLHSGRCNLKSHAPTPFSRRELYDRCGRLFELAKLVNFRVANCYDVRERWKRLNVADGSPSLPELCRLTDRILSTLSVNFPPINIDQNTYHETTMIKIKPLVNETHAQIQMTE